MTWASTHDGRPLLGGIEAGGTKFVLATGYTPGVIQDRHVLPTLDPDTTLDAAAAWFASRGQIAALGIGSFGPVELDRGRARWGHILNTPKPGWSGCDLAGVLQSRLGAPIALDTDVNAAALAEYGLGAGRGAAATAYITIGTGIGAGFVIDGRSLRGAGHPEFGHIYLRRDADDRTFPGICPFHGDCLEGVASGPAILARWGATLSDLPPGHEAHRRIAGYLAQACHTIFAAMAVEVIVLGGGVAHAPGLVETVARETARIGAGYLPGRDRQRIAKPQLGDDAGITGALLLAEGLIARSSP